jgi:hypothetical protein
MTLLATGVLIASAFAIKRHYTRVSEQLRRLDLIVPAANAAAENTPMPDTAACGPDTRTAILLVNGFNGLGLHTVLNATRLFGGAFRNFVFVQVGVVDAGNFKGAAEIERLRAHVRTECGRYVNYLRAQGCATTSFTAIGPDAVEEIVRLAPEITTRFPNAVFFGGQLLFERETLASRWLHNHTIFALQRRLFLLGLPFVILPIRV